MIATLKRRQFITLLGGAAVAWPLAARAQQGERVPLLGWLDAYDNSDTGYQSIRTALREALAKLGWIEGRNLKVEGRFGVADANRLRAYAVELVSLAPDVIIAGGAMPTRALQQATQTIPIVFTGGGDAAAIGLVRNIARPEGNTTGFSSNEPMIGSKWLELLKAAAPHLTRVAIVFNPDLAPTAPNYIASIDAAAQTLSVKTVKVPFRDAVELVRSIDAFAAEPNGSMVILSPPYTAHRATGCVWADIFAERTLRNISPGSRGSLGLDVGRPFLP
jgi:putative tryptophan/tyrosine transport system substrate-binding protein